MAMDNDYMDDILGQYAHREWDRLLESGTVDEIWEVLKERLAEAVGHWNSRCRSNSVPEKRIDFYPDASVKVSHRDLFLHLPEYHELAKQLPDLGEAVGLGSACAQTSRKDYAGRPLARVWIWKEFGDDGSPSQIRYRYTLAPSRQQRSSKSWETLEVPVKAGVIEGDAEAFLQRSVRQILEPLMKAQPDQT